ECHRRPPARRASSGQPIGCAADRGVKEMVSSGHLRREVRQGGVVTATGEQTALAGIMRLVGKAQSSRSRAQALADRAAFALTLIALGAGVVTLLTWLLVRPGDPAFAIERMVTVLVIACPHALGLAIRS